jgi:protoporphyrinogen oxidase
MDSRSIETKYLIIGAGLSGLSAAYHLKDDYILIEATDSPGGTAGTLNAKGFKLDNAVHVFYYKNSWIKNWIINELKVELLEKSRECFVWINNSYVRFPIQYHLSDLSFSSRLSALKSILYTLLKTKKIKVSKTFEEYAEYSFGKYLTNIFVKPYNEKLFGVPLNQMNIDWMGDFVPEYSKSLMLLSFAGNENRNYGRNEKFYYPSEGGISSIANGLSYQLKRTTIYNNSLISILPDVRRATFSDGTEVNYKYLINTIPLNNFISKIKSLPNEILHSTTLLKCNSTTILHILGKGEINCKAHWIYTPDTNIPFYRITIPGNLNPKNCPENHFALTLEFGGDVYQNQIVFDKSIKALKNMGLLKVSNSNFEFHWRLLNCSYVIYDSNRQAALENIFKFLRGNNIWSIGRYGSWEYSNMEDAIIYGKNVAEELLIKD